MITSPKAMKRPAPGAGRSVREGAVPLPMLDGALEVLRLVICNQVHHLPLNLWGLSNDGRGVADPDSTQIYGLEALRNR